MAKRHSGNQSQGSSDWKARLHMVDLSIQDEIQVQEWYRSQKPDFISCFSELLDNGFSVRITPPQSGSDFWATGTAKEVSKDLDGHTWSVRYPDMEHSLIILYYVLTAWRKDGRLQGSNLNPERAWLAD